MSTVLIIDDDGELRSMLTAMLEANGHSAVAVENGLEGVKHFRASPSDVIMTDMMMPYGGLATIRMLREEFPNVAIIAMSGGGAFRLDYARGTGANATLTKPFTVEQLVATLAEVLEKRPPGPRKA